MTLGVAGLGVAAVIGFAPAHEETNKSQHQGLQPAGIPDQHTEAPADLHEMAEGGGHPINVGFSS